MFKIKMDDDGNVVLLKAARALGNLGGRRSLIASDELQ